MGVMAYMFYDDGRELRSKIAEAEKQANSQKDEARKYSAQVNALKAKIGHQFDKIGEDAPEPNTVLYAMKQDLIKYGGKLLHPEQNSLYPRRWRNFGRNWTASRASTIPPSKKSSPGTGRFRG